LTRSLIASVVRPVRIHDTRHTAVTHMLATGIDDTAVADYVGDSVAILMRVYAHVTHGQRTGLVAMIDSLYAGDSEGQTSTIASTKTGS